MIIDKNFIPKTLTFCRTPCTVLKMYLTSLLYRVNVYNNINSKKIAVKRLFTTLSFFLKCSGSLEETIFKAKKNMNIVFLGETGNGKSTLINSFFNILINDTWERALESKTLYVPVCTNYDVPVGNEDDSATISLGIKDNVNLDYAAGNPSASATFGPKSHILKCHLGSENYVFTLVDTPGIKATKEEDAGGNNTSESDSFATKVLEKDYNPVKSALGKNKKTLVTKKDDEIITAILNHVSRLEHIGAIVIVMKAYQEKLSDNFKTTLKPIFNQLTKSAISNIILAITFDHDCKDMSTIRAFKEFVKNENLKIEPKSLHFDNTPFRNLGIKCSEHANSVDMNSMDNRWEKSKGSFKNLISHISRLDENSFQIIKSINTTKQMIKAIVGPLIKICKVGEENLNSLKENYKKSADATGRTLIPIQEKYLTFKKLKSPYTVCTNEMCYKQVKYKEDNQMVDRNLYTSTCCSNCFVPFISHDVKGCKMLYFCGSINSHGICKKCEHGRSEHMHIAYELGEAEKTLEIEESLNLEKKKAQYNTEIEIIGNALAYFSQYLDHHSFYEKGFVDTIFKKQFVDINRNLERQAKDIDDMEDIINKKNIATDKKPPIDFMQDCIDKCKTDIDRLDEKIKQTQKNKEQEDGDTKTINKNKGKQSPKQNSGLDEERNDANIDSCSSLKEKKRKCRKEMASYEKQFQKLKDLYVQNSVTKILEVGMRNMSEKYAKKKDEKPFDPTSQDCVKEIEKLCKMKPHGQQFKMLHQSIEDACESKKFYLETTYHIGTNNNADIPHETFKIIPTEN